MGSAAVASACKFTSGDETSSNDNVCSTYRFSDWAINPPGVAAFSKLDEDWMEDVIRLENWRKT